MSVQESLGPLEAVCSAPLEGDEREILVLLHGRGTDGHDLVDLGPPFGFDGLVVAPHAPMEWELGPGRLWFGDGDRLADVKASTIAARGALAALRERAPEAKLWLGGFSQGGVMTLELGLREPHGYLGLLCMSGWLLDESEVRGAMPDGEAVPPVLLTHGIHDPLVPIERARATAAFLKHGGIAHRVVEDSCDHSLTPRMCAEIASWLGPRA